MKHWTVACAAPYGTVGHDRPAVGSGIPGLVLTRWRGYWKLTHVNTGYGLGPSFDSVKQAWAAIDTVRAQCFVDWTKLTEPAAGNEHRRWDELLWDAWIAQRAPRRPVTPSDGTP